MRNNFSRQVKESFSLGMEESMRLGTRYIGPEHLLLGLIKESDNNALELLRNSHIEISTLKKALETGIKTRADQSPKGNMKIIQIKNFFQKLKFTLNEEAEQIVRGMILEAREFGNSSIDTEHLLLSILRNNNTKAYAILSQLGLDYQKARTSLRSKVRV
ncbi:MAG: hypothetical protein C5B52_04915 [Bacteroidetes bacterium]|nr:MAG: hypothetical protein C5B52_04915 [Bacteroidota bacterium]